MTRTMRALCAAAAGLALAAGLASLGQEQTPATRPSPSAAAPTGEEAILRALEQPTEMSFSETPLRDVLQWLIIKHKIPIALDAKKLNEAGGHPETGVTRSLRGVKLRSALNLLLGDLRLAWVIRDGALTVTSRDDAEQHVVTRTYPVADLLPHAGGRADGARTGYEALLDMVRRTVKREVWSANGGPGRVSATRGVLIVTASQELQRRTADLLAGLRAARKQAVQAKEAERFAPVKCYDHSAEDQIVARLAARVDVDFAERPLIAVRGVLAQKFDLPLQFDHYHLEQWGVALDTPVTLKLSGVSPRSVLDSLCRDLGIAWLVRDEVVLLTSPEEVKNLVRTQVYPVPDLIGPVDNDAEQLLGAIGAVCDGPGDVVYYAPCASLVGLLTPAAHEQLEKLLTAVRSDLAVPTPPAPVPDDAMALRVYRLVEPTPMAGGPSASARYAEEVAGIVRELVAPESWRAKGTRAYLASLPGRLIVRQTDKVQQEIEAILTKLDIRYTRESGGDRQRRGVPPPAGFF